MSAISKIKIYQSLLNLSLLCGATFLLAACGDGSGASTTQLSGTASFAGTWQLKSINSNSIAPASTVIMDVKNTLGTSPLGCNGNFITVSNVDHLVFLGVNVASGCFISFPTDVAQNRATVQAVLAASPAASLDSNGDLVVQSATSSLKFSAQ